MNIKSHLNKRNTLLNKLAKAIYGNAYDQASDSLSSAVFDVDKCLTTLRELEFSISEQLQ
jgi:hypothetical protein